MYTGRGPKTDYGFIPRAKVAKVAPGFTENFSSPTATDWNSRSNQVSRGEAPEPSTSGELLQSNPDGGPPFDRLSGNSLSVTFTGAGDTQSFSQSRVRTATDYGAYSQAEGERPLKQSSSSSQKNVSRSIPTPSDVAVSPIFSLETHSPMPSATENEHSNIEYTPYQESDLAVMQPDEYKICLAIDHRERKSASQLEVQVDGVETLVLPLLLADAVW